VWLLLLLAASVSVAMIGTQITDDLERGLPIEARPSWRGWSLRRFPLAELRRHRAMYPSAAIRKWWMAMYLLQVGLVIVPFLGAIIRSVMSGG
jgi:hypothetical protein